MKDELYFMKEALKEAVKSKNENEIPIGAVIVSGDKIIARAHNMRNGKNSATAHAEILAIEKACKKLNSWRLDDLEMYVTLEPCSMCAGAIANARIEKLHFGAYERKSGAVLSNFRILFKSGLNHTVDVKGGILESECSKILKDFFKEKRGE